MNMFTIRYYFSSSIRYSEAYLKGQAPYQLYDVSDSGACPLSVLEGEVCLASPGGIDRHTGDGG